MQHLLIQHDFRGVGHACVVGVAHVVVSVVRVHDGQARLHALLVRKRDLIVIPSHHAFLGAGGAGGDDEAPNLPRDVLNHIPVKGGGRPRRHVVVRCVDPHVLRSHQRSRRAKVAPSLIQLKVGLAGAAQRRALHGLLHQVAVVGAVGPADVIYQPVVRVLVQLLGRALAQQQLQLHGFSDIRHHHVPELAHVAEDGVHVNGHHSRVVGVTLRKRVDERHVLPLVGHDLALPRRHRQHPGAGLAGAPLVDRKREGVVLQAEMQAQVARLHVQRLDREVGGSNNLISFRDKRIDPHLQVEAQGPRGDGKHHVRRPLEQVVVLATLGEVQRVLLGVVARRHVARQQGP
mmetsp:Transcript_48659/g.93082  ORF Transcript_48659/g.93082 Transcript_48659/m.93082 type:complete len:346 (+) Transcript_48659:4363-5400(+)